MPRISPPPLSLENGRPASVVAGPHAGRKARVVGPGHGADGLMDLDVVKVAFVDPKPDEDVPASSASGKLAKEPWPAIAAPPRPRSNAIPGSWIGPNGFRRKR